MQTKKVLVGALSLALLLGGTYVYGQGGDLQGKFGGSSMTTTKSTGKTTGSSTSTTTTKPDFSLHGTVSYDSSNNTFQVKVCQTNVTSADVKQTSLKFTVADGQSDTVQFTPTVAGSSEVCQTVKSGDLLSDLLIQMDGEYDLTVIVDSTAVQTEANESNNTLTTNDVATESDYYLYDSDQLPDLYVDSMYFDDRDPSMGSLVIATACGFEELKAYPSHNSMDATVTLMQSGRLIASDEVSVGGSTFDGGDCTEIGFALSSSEVAALSSGTVTMYTQLDVMDDVPESDEDNNGFGQSSTDDIVID